MKKFLILTFLSCFSILLHAQTRTISGLVREKGNNEPLIGVSVIVDGTTVGTVTNIDGNFTLQVPDNATKLKVSFIGMKAEIITLTDAENYQIFLTEDAMQVGEVLVTAYGTAKKESFTGSAQMVSTEKLEKRVVSNVTKALDGQIAGVQTTSGSGQPGEGAEVRIRGFGSINSSNDPLYVVDGVPYDGKLNAINSGDIESVTILKDASAGALYGARGANGVIVITTKKAKAGKVNVNLKYSRGVANHAIKPYETLNTADYIEAVWQGYKNEGIHQQGINPADAGQYAIDQMSGTGGIFGENEQYNFYNMDAASLIDPMTGKVNPSAKLMHESDWLDEVTNSNAVREEYQISMDGGTEKLRAFTSFSYLDEEGLLKNTNFKRLSGRIGIEAEAADWFKYGANMNFAQTETDYLSSTGTQTGNVWYSAQFMPHIYPIHQRGRDGKLSLDGLGGKQYDFGTNRPSGASPKFNPIAMLYEDASKIKRDNLSGRTHFDILGKGLSSVLDGLSLSVNYGFDFINNNTYFYYSPEFGNFADSKGRLQKRNVRTFSYTLNQLLRYEKKIGQHNFSLLAGHEFYKRTYNSLDGTKTGFPFSGITELAAGTTTAELTSYMHNYSLESYFGSLQYDFKDRYYFSASYRTDASSRFHKDHRWGQFWSVGASWRISEEAFLQDVSQINNLTLKASYGKQGNDNISTLESGITNYNYYAWQTLYELDWPNATQGGVFLKTLGNEKIKWEENLNMNIGMEARIFDRANITLEYYRRSTTDMLMQKPLGLSTGFDNYWANVGEMLNTGIEFSTAVEVLKQQNIHWTVNGNFSTVKNEIKKLDGDNNQIVSGRSINRVGESINSFYLPESAGVDPATGAQLYYASKDDEDGNAVRYVTDNKQDAVSSSIIAGSRIPDFYGSFGSEFKLFKNFDASFLTTFSVGGDVLDYTYNGLMNPTYIGANYHKNISRAWRKPGDITDVPRIEHGTAFERAMTTDNLIDASYFAIKNVTIGYTLPKHITDNIRLGSVRFYMTMDNLALFSHLDGMDPQYNFSGTTSYVYAPIKTTLFGIDIKF